MVQCASNPSSRTLVSTSPDDSNGTQNFRSTPAQPRAGQRTARQRNLFSLQQPKKTAKHKPKASPSWEESTLAFDDNGDIFAPFRLDHRDTLLD